MNIIMIPALPMAEDFTKQTYMYVQSQHLGLPSPYKKNCSQLDLLEKCVNDLNLAIS